MDLNFPAEENEGLCVREEETLEEKVRDVREDGKLHDREMEIEKLKGNWNLGGKEEGKEGVAKNGTFTRRASTRKCCQLTKEKIARSNDDVYGLEDIEGVKRKRRRRAKNEDIGSEDVGEVKTVIAESSKRTRRRKRLKDDADEEVENAGGNGSSGGRYSCRTNMDKMDNVAKPKVSTNQEQNANEVGVLVLLLYTTIHSICSVFAILSFLANLFYL